MQYLNSFPVFAVGLIACALVTSIGCSNTPVSEVTPGQYNLSPSSRSLKPVALLATHGRVKSADAVLYDRSTTLTGQGSYAVFDFGKEVGGIVTLYFGSTSDDVQSLAVAFSESSLNVGTASDLSNGGNGPDGSLPVAVSAFGSFTVPMSNLRGGFRYVTIALTSNGSVELSGVTLQFTAAPAMLDLRDYEGAFISNDDLLNRIWYAGAYTVQMDLIDPQQGRIWPPPSSGWFNNGIVGNGSSVLVDGAKRDRTIWPGDLGISARTDYVAFSDTTSMKNDLELLFAHQGASGCFPDSGPEINFECLSDTYHLWTLDAALEYYLYSGDQDWLAQNWSQIQLGINFSTAKIDGKGLLFVTLTGDWGRQESGGEEISANALLYRVLQLASAIGPVVGDSASEAAYKVEASSLREAIESRLWDGKMGMYRDTPGSSLYPQDGNSLAVWFGIPQTASASTKISGNLRNRWNNFGALTPEMPEAIATFPGSMEVMAHFAAGDDESALNLIRLEWGYMLSNPLGTRSTFWEGYLQNGSFGFGGSYISLAHGWATGPTGALSEYVAGIGPELSSPAQFHFIPHTGDLSTVSATVPLPDGTVNVSWKRELETFTASVNAPSSMVGRYGIPIASATATVLIDDEPVWSSCTPFVSTKLAPISFDGSRVYVSGLAGSHTVTEHEQCDF